MLILYALCNSCFVTHLFLLLVLISALFSNFVVRSESCKPELCSV